MSEVIQTTLITSGGLFLGAIATVYGTRFVAKLTAKSKSQELELEEDKIRAGAYTEARESYRELVADLRKEIAGVRTAQDEDRRAHRDELEQIRQTHRRQIDELREERREHQELLNRRIDQLESQRNGDRRLIEALNSYIRQLIRLLRDAGISPPPAPRGMHFDTD